MTLPSNIKNVKKLLLVFGTRPEAIKMAPLVLKLKREDDVFDTKVCVTGQHREMLDQVLGIFNIVPDYDLNIMRPNQDLYDVTSRILTGMRDVLTESEPDIVMVHGDTTTSMAASLASFYKQIPVAHVEAGLRTNNIYSPWPEEMNRQITARIAKYNLAPTERAKLNLLKENISEETITVTGNTVIDALHWVLNKISVDKLLQEDLNRQIHSVGYDVDRLGDRRLVLITGHRRENFGEGFDNICHAIKELAQENKDVDFVYPMHLNPNVRKPVKEIIGEDSDNVFLTEPLQYLQFIYMMEKSYIILTDSGGVQEEAPSIGKPVLVMRDTTERPEAVMAGTVKLVGKNKKTIKDSVCDLLHNAEHYKKMAHAENPYGDGKACDRIIEYLKSRI